MAQKMHGNVSTILASLERSFY